MDFKTSRDSRGNTWWSHAVINATSEAQILFQRKSSPFTGVVFLTTFESNYQLKSKWNISECISTQLMILCQQKHQKVKRSRKREVNHFFPNEYILELKNCETYFHLSTTLWCHWKRCQNDILLSEQVISCLESKLDPQTAE